MTKGIARESGARPGLAPGARRTAGALLTLAGLALASGAMCARLFDAALPETTDGAPAALGHDVGDDAAFAPFAFAVVGPPRGDAAALERALDEIGALDVGPVVVLGDVLPEGGENLNPLADVLNRHWEDLVLLAGPRDAEREVSDARIAARVQPPEGWAFLAHGCLFRDSENNSALGESAAVFTFTTEPVHHDDATSFGPLAVVGDRLAYEIVHVRAPNEIRRTRHTVAGGASLASAARAAALTSLWPLAATATGLAGLLALAAGITWCGVLLASPSHPRVPRRRRNSSSPASRAPAVPGMRRAAGVTGEAASHDRAVALFWAGYRKRVADGPMRPRIHVPGPGRAGLARTRDTVAPPRPGHGHDYGHGHGHSRRGRPRSPACGGPRGSPGNPPLYTLSLHDALPI
jgi:hypothetical protein